MFAGNRDSQSTLAKVLPALQVTKLCSRLQFQRHGNQKLLMSFSDFLTVWETKHKN